MALQYIGSANGTTTLTFPEHKIGDVLIIFAFRDGSTINPTVGAGFTSITTTADGTSCSASIGFRIATVTNTASGTWTNASRVVGLVYRNQQTNIVTPFGTGTYTSNTTNTYTYGARAMSAVSVRGSAWFIAFAGHTSIDQNLQDPPSGMVLRDNSVDATCEVSAFDTNGAVTTDWPATNVALTGTVGNGVSAVIELRADGQEMENYKTIGALGNAGVISVNSLGGW
jgi:hypothetical protein